jgi:RNA polymerase sigma factor (sigma-70 family)
VPPEGLIEAGDAQVVIVRGLGLHEIETFCTAIYPRLVGALSLACDDPELAEELAQDALSRVVERWERVRVLDDAEAYTFQIGFNLARSWWRRRAAERRAHARASEATTHHDEDVAQNVALRQSLAKLSARQREAIVHRYFLAHSVSETAKSMNCAEGTVKALTSQGIDVLRKDLGVSDE